MCGRFQLVEDAALVAKYFAAQTALDFHARYNVAPRQDVPVVTAGTAGRVLADMGWGLLPSWAPDLRKAPRPINARAESVSTSGMFKRPFARQRCIVPASGFYEWQALSARCKVPFLITLRDKRLFGMAGLFDVWRDADGRTTHTFAIVTTEPNGLVANVHDRMPVILGRDDEALWLDPKAGSAELGRLLTSYPAADMRATPVSKLVNSVANEGPDVAKPA